MDAPPNTILLVEDDLGQADLIRINLELGNVTQDIVHVTDGQQALDFILRSGPFEGRPAGSVLVLLDLKLPVLDGIEFLREVKGRWDSRQTPVLVFAAESNPRLIAQCYELGCSLYFPKPLAVEDYISTVEKMAQVIRVASLPPAV